MGADGRHARGRQPKLRQADFRGYGEAAGVGPASGGGLNMTIHWRRRWLGLIGAAVFSVMAWGSAVAIGVAVIR